MLMTRRGFLGGMAGILAAAAAPAIITTPGLLMPVKKIWTPEGPPQVVTMSFDGRIWIHNGTGSLMTVTAMDYGGWHVNAPNGGVPLDPGESLVFDTGPKVFSKWNASPPEIKFNSAGWERGSDNYTFGATWTEA